MVRVVVFLRRFLLIWVHLTVCTQLPLVVALTDGLHTNRGLPAVQVKTEEERVINLSAFPPQTDFLWSLVSVRFVFFYYLG